MHECICNGCRNLKGVVDENGAIEEYECEFGYPAEDCGTCETGECELFCNHYVSDEEEAEPSVVKCATCGRELRQACSNDEEGSVQCIDCYLKNISK